MKAQFDYWISVTDGKMNNIVWISLFRIVCVFGIVCRSSFYVQITQLIVVLLSMNEHYDINSGYFTSNYKFYTCGNQNTRDWRHDLTTELVVTDGKMNNIVWISLFRIVCFWNSMQSFFFCSNYPVDSSFAQCEWALGYKFWIFLWLFHK